MLDKKTVVKMPKSGKPRKQRKFRAKAPINVRKRFLNVHISKELKNKIKTKKRAILVNKGDTVRVRKGKFKGRTGKVVDVDYIKLKVYMEGVTQTNVRGQEKNVSLEPSNLEIINLNMTEHRKKKLGL
ncbi:50S ribosomal protein L24 [Candidatus Micrarchaeota archaeon]|nr:50S ribosomal protein L24 [Candidatus Micrarchaeota archaeon]